MRRRSYLLVAAIVIGASFLGIARVFKGYSPAQAMTFFLAPTPKELCDAGEPIARAIEAYFHEHGQYPASLHDARIDAPETYFGPWRYSVSNNRQECSLSVGDYGRYSFEVWWSPENGWYVDD